MSFSIVKYNNIDYKCNSVHCDVPQNPMGKLMYYLNCVHGMTDYDIPEELRDYENYYMLSKDQEDRVLILISALSPELLLEKKFMVVDKSLCEDSQNKFYEIADKTKNPIKAISFGGKMIRSTSLMACENGWINDNYYEPKKLFADRILYISQKTLNL